MANKAGIPVQKFFQSTPPRRRRRCNTARILSNAFFNPRLREGGDNSALSTLIRYKSFQSTPPRRRRRRRVFHSKRWMLFNPRLREGGDFYYAGNNVFTKLFNPRLREGGDGKRNQRQVARSFQSTPPRRRRPQHIVIPQLSCAYLVSTTFLSTIFSFISQYIVLFPLFRVRMPCVFCVAYDSHYVPLFNIFYILFQGTPF